MNKKRIGDYMSWLVISALAILLLEIVFFSGGLIFALFLAGTMIYFGRKKSPSLFWRFIFWTGISILVASLMNMFTFRLVLVAFLIFGIIQFAHSRKTPNQIVPLIHPPGTDMNGGGLVRTRPLFKNILFGQQKTPGHVYDWNDINIQAGVGDTTIDLSYTLLPKGETVIFIRNFIGNVTVLVPYELEVSISHSVLAGSTTVFGAEEPKLFNQVFQLKTLDYDKSSGQKVKIFTSLIVGNLEVSRI